MDDNDKDILQRLAVLEERVNNNIAETNNLLTGIKTAMEEAKADLLRYKGFMGGVTFIISAIFTVLMLLKERILG